MERSLEKELLRLGVQAVQITCVHTGPALGKRSSSGPVEVENYERLTCQITLIDAYRIREDFASASKLRINEKHDVVCPLQPWSRMTPC